MKKVLVLFSGGKDSLLATVRYLDSGYQVYLITYENSCCIGGNNVFNTTNRLIKKYGKDKVRVLGNKNITAIFRNFIYPFYNYKANYVCEKFGPISISQFNCLACRLAMYVSSIIISRQLKIKLVIDGARICQLFVIEQEKLLACFQSLFLYYDLNIEYPLKDLNDDWELKNELLIRGIIPKTVEPQCLLGCPLCKEDIDDDIVNAVYNVYNEYLKENAMDVIRKYENIDISEDFV